MGNESADRVSVPSEELIAFSRRILSEAGLSRSDAETVAETIVDANLRGIDTHGVVRLPTYVERIRKGGINPNADIRVEKTENAAAIVDGDGGAGQIVTTYGMETAMEMAATEGVAVVGIRNSNHFGTASYYTNLAAEDGFIGLSMTHSSSNVVPFGGSEPYFGTNPLSIAVPSNFGFPVTLDMATSVTSKGAILEAQEADTEIPPEWAINETGKPIEDPNEYHALRPVGGPKGYGLGLMVDVFCGVLLDTVFGWDIAGMFDDMHSPPETGHFVGAIDVTAFTEIDAFTDRLARMKRELKSIDTRDGFDEVLLPGEPEARTRRTRESDGIPLDTELTQTLLELGNEYDIEPPDWATSHQS